VLFAWPPDHIAALRLLMAEGHSARTAAIEMNKKFGTAYSRNAIIGRCRREGVANVNRPGSKPKAEAAPSEAEERKPTADKSAVVKRGLVKRVRASDAPPAAPHRPIPFLKLKSWHCRAPLGEGMDEMVRDADGLPLFCGRTKLEGSSYCVEHHRRFVAGHVQLEKEKDLN